MAGFVWYLQQVVVINQTDSDESKYELILFDGLEAFRAQSSESLSLKIDQGVVSKFSVINVLRYELSGAENR